MKLSELNPELRIGNDELHASTYLWFDCPVHRQRHIHICIDGEPAAGHFKWQMTATQPIAEMFEAPQWDQISITPSINAHDCGHFYITNGEIVKV